MSCVIHFENSNNPQAKHRPRVILIPGGPCYSSLTLRDLSILKLEFNLGFLDPPGTGKSPLTSPNDYATMLEAIESSLKNVRENLILLGHSFGGIQAMEITVRNSLDINGLCVIATPFTEKAFREASVTYRKLHNQEMAQAEEEFRLKPSSDAFLEMNLAYSCFYFREANDLRGRAMLKSDPTSYEAYLGGTEGGQHRGHLLKDLKQMKIPKLFLAGDSDIMFPPTVLAEEARLGGFDFKIVSSAGHFVSLDQAERVRSVFSNFFLSPNLFLRES